MPVRGLGPGAAIDVHWGVDEETDKAEFDWDEFRKVVAVFTRMLDNVVEINGLPLEQQRNEIFGKRRHGMGYLGLGSTISLLGMKYGDAESLAFTEEVTLQMALAGWQQALDLAREKGPAPALTASRSTAACFSPCGSSETTGTRPTRNRRVSWGRYSVNTILMEIALYMIPWCEWPRIGPSAMSTTSKCTSGRVAMIGSS